jgi:glycosyltransferase involved in cell wall biosynthesis
VKILHIIPNLSKGGAERLVLDIVRSQRLISGYSVQLVVLSPENAYAEEYPDIHPISIASYVSPSLTKPWKSDLREWEELISKFKPDLIHSHLFAADFFVHFKPLTGVKYVTHCHDNMRQLKKMSLIDWFSKKRITESYERNFLLKQYIKTSTHFIAISSDTKEYFSKVLPKTLLENIHLLHNAINYQKFSRNAAKWPGNDVRKLVNAGSFVPKKNQMFLLEVMEQLKKSSYQYELSLLGDGHMRAELVQQIEKRNLKKHVKMPGNVDSIEEYYWESHLMTHSATYEPFGLVLLEGMAAGLPVASLDGRGNRVLLEDSKKGPFMPAETSAVDFAKAVEKCFENEESWKNYSRNSKELSKLYRIDTYVSRLNELYTKR